MADAHDTIGSESELPGDAIEEAERLTRLAREAVDDGEARAHRERRAELLAEYEFTARVRQDDTGETLVLHPAEWVDDEGIRTERIEDVDRAVEISLSGPGEPEEWREVADHNDALAAAVRADHGDVHGDNARAFAEFMSNHYAKPAESATAGELEEFLAEYYPRNAWPSAEQKAVVESSLRHVFDAADARMPEFSR